MSVETLAQALLDAGILDKPSVDYRVPRVRSGRQLLEGIINDGVAAEPNLVNQLARALSVPRYDPKERSPEPDAVALLDARSSEEMGVVPVAVRGGGALLWVALCDPTDEALIAEVQRRTGRRVKACLIGPRELTRALQQIAQGGMQAPPPVMSQQPQGYPPQQGMPNAGVSGQYRVPLPLPSGIGQPGNSGFPGMPNGVPPGMQPMPQQGGGYPYGYAPQGSMPPPMQQPMMGQPQMPGGYSMPLGTGAYPAGPPSRPGVDVQRLEDELAQARQVVKVLTQILVERGLIDGEDLKRRLRAERERKG
jgi:hypothetical protein